MAAQLIHDRVEMECLEGAWETLEGNTRCQFRGTIRFTATSLVHPDEPARTLQRTVEWILPTPTPYRLVEPVQVIEVTSSEEDPEEDLEELPPEPVSLSEELRDYYEGRHRSHLRPHSHRREKERKPQEANINLPYFHGKDNVEANLDWEIRVEQQLKKKSTSKSYGSHSYPKKDQGQGILGVTPSKPKDDKGKAIEKQAPKARHITSQCPTTKTMIMRGQDIYSSQDEATTSPSSSESEEAKRDESKKCKEVSVSSKRLAKKETHFTIKTNIKETFPHRQPPHFLFCKKTLASIATPLGVEFIPQVKKLLDEDLVRKSLNPCALLVPKIGIIRHQVPKIGGMMNVLSGATLFCKITRTPNIFMVEGMMQSYPARALDRRLQVDWARDPREGPRVLMSLRVDFETMG
ncbi:hypothetical protein HKD37_03G006811 [Glycine soja]